MTGGVGGLVFGAGAALIISVPMAYYTSYLQVDVEDYGSQELMMEGAMPAVAVYVLVWTTLYNGLHLGSW